MVWNQTYLYFIKLNLKKLNHIGQYIKTIHWTHISNDIINVNWYVRKKIQSHFNISSWLIPKYNISSNISAMPGIFRMAKLIEEKQWWIDEQCLIDSVSCLKVIWTPNWLQIHELPKRTINSYQCLTQWFRSCGLRTLSSSLAEFKGPSLVINM